MTAVAAPLVALGERSLTRFLALTVVERLLLAVTTAVITVGLVLRLAIAWLDIETLVLKVMPDDAFYYLLTAERITSGQGISFDGIHAANGYHPLWLFALVPVYLLPGRELPLHVALSLAAVFDIASGCFVGLTVAKLSASRTAGLFALTTYTLLPRNVVASVSGMETSLAAMLLAALLYVIVSVWREERHGWLRWAGGTGALGGLTVLARLDSAVTVAAVFALIALFQPGARRWLAPTVSAATAAIITLPWFLWSWVAIGTPGPRAVTRRRGEPASSTRPSNRTRARPPQSETVCCTQSESS